MLAPPIPTPPSKRQALLGLEMVATKQMTGFRLHLTCDFLPFLGQILDSPTYPQRHLFFSRNFILKPALQILNASLGPHSDFCFSLTFFASVSMWMLPAIAQGKGDFVRSLLHSREEFLTDDKPNLPITQQAVAKDTTPITSPVANTFTGSRLHASVLPSHN